MKKRSILLGLLVLAILLVSCASTYNSSYYYEPEVINVLSVKTMKPNSAGGVDVRIVWQNLSDKVIKYARFKVAAFNAVDDPVYCEITGKNIQTLKDTGPIKKSWSSAFTLPTLWENVWWNSTIKRAEIISIELEYMDGTVKTITPAVY